MKVLSLVERETGRARSFVLDNIGLADIAPIVQANLSREARLRTDVRRRARHVRRHPDEATVYQGIGWHFREHETVNHKRDEYVRRNDPTVHTNTIEGYFSIFSAA